MSMAVIEIILVRQSVLEEKPERQLIIKRVIFGTRLEAAHHIILRMLLQTNHVILLQKHPTKLGGEKIATASIMVQKG